MSEYYFDYVIQSDQGNLRKPKIYFEKDYTSDTLPYSIFAVPHEWIEAKDPVKLYDSINVIFDVYGEDCEELKRTREGEIKYFQTYDNFRRSGCRVPIDNYNSSEHSGVGLIEMNKDGKVVGRFVFAINFCKKKKIYYSITKGTKYNDLTVKFRCKDQVKDIRVNLTYNNRLPCLKNDVNVNILPLEPLDFTSRSTCSRTVDINPNISEDSVFSLAFADESDSKYFVLHCESNNTVEFPKESKKLPRIVYNCPYCHEPIDNRITDNRKYKRGGISCGFYTKHGRMPTVITEGNQKLKSCMFCSKDFVNESGGGELNGEYSRLLPDKFMDHDSFKIAFLGSKRAGKTTYISRFFDLGGDNTAEMSMASLINSMKKMKINLEPAKIPSVTLLNSSSLTYRLNKESWTSQNPYYLSRRINLEHYPEATNQGTDETAKRYPFIAEVNKSSYVSFYDVAGEDAQTKQIVQTLAGGAGQYIGVFCIVSGLRDASAAHEVFDKLLTADIHRDSPIAIIMTKFDTLIEDFDPNCRCLRTDYFDGSSYYNGSELQKEIDFSSEEIKSYLKQQSIDVDLSGKYKNVKYFGVSSFNFEESVQIPDGAGDTPERLNFECSPSRIELPFIWMLSKFGIIK